MAQMHLGRRIELAMPGDETNRLCIFFERPRDGVCHLTQINRVLGLGAATLDFDNGGVVELDAIVLRRDQLGVEVERAQPQMRMPARDDYLGRGGHVLLAYDPQFRRARTRVAAG
jgi:hypothetical protein